MRFDALQEPHASVADRLSRTKLFAAISAGKGSALAFVSTWPDHVSIDACVVNPGYLVLGEEAEAALLDHVVKSAKDDGATDIRLHPTYQVDESFYENRGFHPKELSESGAEADAILFYSQD